MQTGKNTSHFNIFGTLAELIYLAVLSFYPKQFRVRFGAEMKTIFNEGLQDNLQFGFFRMLRYFGKEIKDAPGSILKQHMVEKTPWLQPYPVNLLVFPIGFMLIGLLENGDGYYFKGFFSLIMYLLVGGLGGFAFGINFDSSKKKFYSLCGAIGFLFANITVPALFYKLYPTAFITPGTGFNFLIPFLYPLLIGGVYGLFLWIASFRLRHLLKFVAYTSIAFTVGFCMNRLFAALMQSYILQSPTQIVSQPNLTELILFILMPYFLQGVTLGLAFGKFSKGSHENTYPQLNHRLLKKA